MGAQDEVVHYRLERAREALHHARLLAAADGWNACVNRLYYACFYAVSALLLQRGLSSSKHTGIRSLFNQHLVKTGEISQELAEFYNNLFKSRQVADYTDFVRFERDQIEPWIAAAENFVERVATVSAADSDAEQVPQAEPEQDEADAEGAAELPATHAAEQSLAVVPEGDVDDLPPPPIETIPPTDETESKNGDRQEPDPD